jgi:dihydroorotate dehydrogenase
VSVYKAVWPLIRQLDPETAHKLTLRLLSIGAHGVWPRSADDASLRTEVCGLRFPNPVGLAAGFDKDGVAPSGVLALGFGFIELGTVTPRPQAGNPRPRLFRLAEDRAVINRLGFNNKGAEALAARLFRDRPPGIIGINIGANRDSADRVADYISAFDTVAPCADYITINISSPNTKGLRELQRKSELHELITRLQGARDAGARALPLLVKIAPDLSPRELDDIVETVLETRIDGLIISNTTIAREGLHSMSAGEEGGLSGVPLFERSTRLLREVYRATHGRVTLVGVGGISSARDAYEKILAGASLVQLYTGLVYEGPGLVTKICQGLASLLKTDGFKHVSEAVGVRSRDPIGQGAGMARSAV